VSILAVAGWVATFYFRAALFAPCSNYGCYSFSEYVKNDQFCALDPTCVSPFYKAGIPGVQNWVDLQSARLPAGQQSPDGVHALAIPNYVLFMIVLAIIIGLVVKHVRRMRTRKLILTALFTWLSIEITFWFVFAAISDRNYPLLNPWILVEACGTFLVSISFLMLVVHVASCRWSARLI
jgi:hypothetical protein